MIEIPESITLSKQIAKEFKEKTVAKVVAGSTPHGFAFFSHDTAMYPDMLEGKVGQGDGPFVTLWVGQGGGTGGRSVCHTLRQEHPPTTFLVLFSQNVRFCAFIFCSLALFVSIDVFLWLVYGC